MIRKNIFRTVVIGLTLAIFGTSSAWAGKSVIVARVKDKEITLQDLNKTMAPYRYQYEAGGVDFTSPSGKLALQRLQSQVLQQMVARELLQIGAKAKKVKVSDSELKSSFKEILNSQKADEKTFIRQLSKFGWSEEYFLKDLQNQLIEDKFIKEHLTDEGVNPWLAKEAKTGVEVFFKIDVPKQADTLKEAEKAGLDYYKKAIAKSKDPDTSKGLSAKATNYGCHTQVDIIKEGKIIKSFGYSGGQVYEID